MASDMLMTRKSWIRSSSVYTQVTRSVTLYSVLPEMITTWIYISILSSILKGAGTPIPPVLLFLKCRDWCGAKTFDVYTSSTHNKSFPHTFDVYIGCMGGNLIINYITLILVEFTQLNNHNNNWCT